MLVEAKRGAIIDDGGDLGLRAPVDDDEVDGKRVPCRLPAVERLVSERDGGARRGGGVGIHRLETIKDTLLLLNYIVSLKDDIFRQMKGKHSSSAVKGIEEK